VDRAAVRVLGALLTEIDVFESTTAPPPSQGNKKSADDDNHQEEVCASLQAFAVALQISVAADVATQEQLLPSLAAVLASAEGDDSRVALLQDCGVLGLLVTFFEAYWRSATHVPSICWACEAIELWVSMDQQRVFETGRLQASMIEFLQSMLQETRTAESVVALSTVVGCYVTLQGEEPPGEPDSTILQQVLELCASYDR
jgi:hypothetical protein